MKKKLVSKLLTLTVAVAAFLSVQTVFYVKASADTVSNQVVRTAAASQPLSSVNVTAQGFEPNMGSTVLAGNVLKVTANVTGGVGDLTYKFSYAPFGGGAVHELGTQVNNNTMNVIFKDCSKITVRVDVTDSTGKTVGGAITVYVTDSAPLSQVELIPVGLTLNAGYNITPGSPLKLVADVHGGSGDYTYRFYYATKGNEGWNELGTQVNKNIINVICNVSGYITAYVDVTDNVTGLKVTGSTGFGVW